MDKVVMKGEREERRKGEKEKSTVCHKCQTQSVHYPNNTPRHSNTPPQNKNRKAGKMRMRGEMGKGVSDGLGER